MCSRFAIQLKRIPLKSYPATLFLSPIATAKNKLQNSLVSLVVSRIFFSLCSPFFLDVRGNPTGWLQQQKLSLLLPHNEVEMKRSLFHLVCCFSLRIYFQVLFCAFFHRRFRTEQSAKKLFCFAFFQCFRRDRFRQGWMLFVVLYINFEGGCRDNVKGRFEKVY